MAVKEVKTYQAKRLPEHRGAAAWRDILPPRKITPALDKDILADFVVIGGGFAGLSAARRLTQLNPGSRIVVLEAGAIAEGAAGRNSGFMIDLPHDLASESYAGQAENSDLRTIHLNRKAIDFAREAVEEYKINPAYFDLAGKVNGAASDAGNKHNQDYAKHLGRLDEPSEMLDAQAMTELTGSRHYLSGLYTPGTAMLQPAGYIQGVADGLQRSVQIFENTPVTRFSKVSSDWLLTTPTGTVTSPRIIVANNGHLESFGFSRGRLMHVFLYASMTPDLDANTLKAVGGQPKWGITPADPMGTTMRRIDTPLGGNRIVTRTCASFLPEMKVSQGELDRTLKVQQKKFDDRFPQIAGLKMEYSWAGHLCLSKNNVSIMREIEDNVFSACCQNGLGTARGTMTGIGAAELASGYSSEITKEFKNEDAPEKLPPRPISTIGANVYLRWKEWRAGRE
ncbi:NAD(P)/FAD-dependent oxidoreductase [Kiloniella sp.]|uniref:NAD(P)/FAD-dependent oxidoreductase n=1 Tax=Kiloniella sp. TaxID=1938587 RepID=UPI003B01E153